MKSLLTLILILVNIYPALCQQLKEVSSYSENIYSPSDFYVLNGDTILTVELENKEAVLSIHDLKNKKVIATRRAGRGPGELSQNGVKYITKMGADSLWIWDEGHRRGMIYDNKLNYLGDISVEDHGISSALFLNDTTVIAKKMFDRGNIVGFYRLEENQITGEIYQQLKADDISSLIRIAENPLLNQGPMISEGEDIYLGFSYGSTVLNFSSKGKIDTLATPYFLPLPIVDYQGGYAAPDHSKHPMATLDIGIDSDYVYILFSGRKFESNLFKNLGNAVTGKLADKVEESENSREVYIFDKNSNQNIGNFELPVLSKRISVHGDNLYSLSYRDKRYHIIKYEMY